MGKIVLAFPSVLRGESNVNEIRRLTEQIDELTTILGDLKRSLERLAHRPSYGSEYIVRSNRRLNPSSSPISPIPPFRSHPPRQTETVDYARRPFPE